MAPAELGAVVGELKQQGHKHDDVAEGAVDVADGGPKKDDIPSDDAGTSAIVMIFFRALDLGEFVSSLGERAVRNFFLLPPAGGTN